MKKNNKGLADTQEGEFILNESGTSVSSDPVEGIDTPAPNDPQQENKNDNEQNRQDWESEEKNVTD